jgi:hypothetical protein
MAGALAYLTLAALTVPQDSDVVELERMAADGTAFETGAPHAGAHPLDDQVAFEFRDGSDDNHDGPAQRASGIDLLAEANELDVEPVEFVEDLEEVLHRPGDPVRGPDQQNFEAVAAGVAHQGIETRPAGPGAADRVGVLLDDLVAALLGHLAEVKSWVSR